MKISQIIIDRMKAVIPNLPQDWAGQVADRMGIDKSVVYNYVRGTRGKRNKEKAGEILKHMIEIEREFRAKIEGLIS